MLLLFRRSARWRGLVLLGVLALTGCGGNADVVPTTTPMPAGARVDPPAGWVDYCTRTPEDTGCPSS